MANSNISHIQLVNTFNEWRAATNDLVEDRNILRNAHYVKDNSDFTLSNGSISISNGTMFISRSSNGTVLTVANSGNVLVGGFVNATAMNANTFFGRGSGLNLESVILNAYAAANAAANTVRLSANSLSTLSAKQLNFVNTSTVVVSITSNPDGSNANVEFIASGGISGGILNGDLQITGNLIVDSNTTVTLKSYKDYILTNTNVNAANTVDLSKANWFKYTLTGSSGNRQLTFANAPITGNGFTATLLLIQDGTGGKTPTWGNTIYWAGGQVPPATTTASANDLWTFTTYDGGSSFIGTLAVKDAR